MSLAAFEQFGVKTEQDGETPQDWAPMSAEELWRFSNGPEAAPANEHARPFPASVHRPLKLSARLLWRVLAVIDWLVVAAIAQIAAFWGHGAWLSNLALSDALTIAAGAASLKAGLWLTGTYGAPPSRVGPEHALGGLALGAVIGLCVSGIAAPDARLAAALAATLPLGAILLAGVHAAFALWLSAACRRGAFAETAIIVGATPAAARFIMRAHADGDIRVAAIVDDRGARAPTTLAGAPVAGGVADLLAWNRLPDIDRIIICISHGADQRVRALIERLKIAPNRIEMLFDYEVAHASGRRLDHIAGAPIATITGRKPNAARAFVKRVQDIVLGTLLAIAFAPLMLVIAIAVRIDGGEPSLFKQRRYGLNNRVITIWKFRTMRQSACAEPMTQVCPHDPRVTRIGRFLRRTSLDELPQLYNVLKGEMSLVGPRPHAIDMRASDCELSSIVAEYAHRHRVKPGLTGWAQVHGSRGPIEAPEAVRRRVALDLDYISKASLWLDLWIIARTIPALLGDRKAVR